MEHLVGLITGSARGLGKAFSEALLKRGARVCICDRDIEVGQQTADDLGKEYGPSRVTFIKCDVTSQSDIEGAIKHTVDTFGGLDIFCNNAGIATEQPYQRMIDINLTGVIRGTLASLDQMDKRKGGRGGVIINVSSVSGLLPTRYEWVYVTTKHAVVGFSRSLGLLSPRRHGVRVNCLCPTFALTDILMQTAEHTKKSDSQVKNANRMTDTIGIMQPEEVAEAFIRLVEDETLSGAVVLVTPDRKEVLRLPLTVPEMFAACKM